MCTSIVLVVLDFIKTFIFECDALGKGIGTMLRQEGCPLKFIGKQLCSINLQKFTHEKEN